jgi:drug/metabolite transporter (DMT)-like permease
MPILQHKRLKNMSNQHVKWLFLIVLALIWGSSFILIKRGLIGLTPLQLGAARITFSSVFLLIIGFGSLRDIRHYQWKYIALTSLFGTFIPAFLFAIAQTQISSSVSSILNSLTPLNTLLIGVVAFGLTFKRAQIIGVLIGLAGTLLLIINGMLSHPNQNYSYTLLVLIASLCYATNVNLIKKHLSDVRPLSITTGNFLVMLVPAASILFATSIHDHLGEIKIQNALFFVMILGVVGTGLANILFYKLIQISSPVFATSVTYLIPVVATIWGLYDGESLSSVQGIGALIILTGVYLSSKK